MTSSNPYSKKADPKYGIIARPYFSVLMPTYEKCSSTYLDRALASIWDDQVCRPTEIILVIDGPIRNDSEIIIKGWKNKLGDSLQLVRLGANVGIAKALNAGLKYCNYEIIARMDHDDISLPLRFASQLDFLTENVGVDVVGTFIQEIDEHEDIVKKVVKYPTSHSDCYKYFRKRDPLAHPTVMFRSSFFDAAGNYPTHINLAEDTLLWYQGFKTNCVFANIDEIGLQYRRTPDFYARRADHTKSIELLRYRLKTINRDLGYGILGDVYALLYYLICMSPRFIKKILYSAR